MSKPLETPELLDVPTPIEAPSEFKGKTGIDRIWHAFINSCSGLTEAFRHESAFRQEVVLAAILIPTALFVPVTTVERLLLLATVVLVLIVELLNTAVEVTIDRISLERHPLSKRAKDTGSAAVLVALLLVALVWGVILIPRFLGA